VTVAWRGPSALVTGAASGMGRLCTWRLAAQGIAVTAVDVDADGLATTAQRAPSVTPVVCDVTDAAAVATLVDETEARQGPLVTVVHAAAVAPSGEVVASSPDVVRRAMDVNFGGFVNLTAAVMPRFLQRGHADYVIFGSTAGFIPSPTTGAYSATKHATVAYAETLWQETLERTRRSDVRIVCVCPPAVRTPMLERFGYDDDMLERIRPIEAADVLDAVERSLRRGDFWCFPGPATRALLLARRLAPGTLWRLMRGISGGMTSSARTSPPVPPH
jgi:NAD(P)-dependent dehydrogenase (short-subunit alcohol dehydrogenase family)